MNNNEITLLSSNQESDNTIIKKIGRKCAITDFAILLGAYVDKGFYVDDDSSMKGRTGWWYLSDSNIYLRINVINTRGQTGDMTSPAKRSGGIRPVIPFSKIEDISTSGVRGKNGVLEIEYGEYPQYVVDINLGKTLDNELFNGRLRKTGKIYTTDSREWNDFSEPFRIKQHEEYEYKGKRYILVESINTGDGHQVSNGVTTHAGDKFWIEVSPIKWYVDEKEKLLISKNIIASGVRFFDDKTYNGNFKKTEMYTFLNTYFAKDMFPLNYHKMTPEEVKELEKRKNPYNLKFEQVCEEDIIRGAIKSGVPVFLHGRSSEGKSARIKQIDPDCTILYLRNATPEGVNGKCVFNQVTGKIIDVKPTWLEKIEEKCKAEPDKLHILFLDEITNALPSIQGMAFNIILDKEVNGKWHLPENARIVAAGNDMKDSLAANKLAEPLFNRFAHVYIETTTDKWLKWAAKNKIHPAIYSFIAFKGKSVLRSEFNGEMPNADPRKWEMASKMLYETSSPEMLRALIGEDITKEFVEFCRTKVITLEDVLANNFDYNQINNLDTSERYATVMALSRVEEKDIEKVRNFIKNFDEELISLFDMIWSSGDEERLAILAELNIKEKQK